MLRSKGPSPSRTYHASRVRDRGGRTAFGRDQPARRSATSRSGCGSRAAPARPGAVPAGRTPSAPAGPRRARRARVRGPPRASARRARPRAARHPRPARRCPRRPGLASSGSATMPGGPLDDQRGVGEQPARVAAVLPPVGRADQPQRGVRWRGRPRRRARAPPSRGGRPRRAPAPGPRGASRRPRRAAPRRRAPARGRPGRRRRAGTAPASMRSRSTLCCGGEAHDVLAPAGRREGGGAGGELRRPASSSRQAASAAVAAPSSAAGTTPAHDQLARRLRRPRAAGPGEAASRGRPARAARRAAPGRAPAARAGRAPAAGRPVARGQLELRVLAQDRLLELLQLLARVEAELLLQLASRAAR